MRLGVVFFFLFTFFGVCSYAQDIITMRAGNQIRAKVLTVTKTEVSYKNFDNQDGPTYVVPSSDVKSIKYQNGAQDNFPEPEADEAPAPKKKEPSYYDNGRSYTPNSGPPKVGTYKQTFGDPDDLSPSFISVSIGVAAPIGSYSSINVKDSTSGYANSGLNFTLEGMGRITRGFGIGGMIGNFSNQVDQSFNQNLIAFAQLNGIFYQSSILGKWSNTYYMVGPYFTSKTGILAYDVKILLGAFSSTSPTITANCTDSTGNNFSVVEQSANTTSFAYGIGGNLRFIVGQNMGLFIGGELLSSKPQFNESYIITNGYSTIPFFTQKVSQQITVINLKFGLAYHFR